VQLLPAVVDAQTVRCVDYPDQGVGLFKVVSPVRAQRLLSADVPCAVSLEGEGEEGGGRS
jgi:hypothetical protein